MDRLIRKSWWKALSIIILLYVFVVGLLVPLKPNVTTVSPSATKTGENIELQVQGYNTHFASQAKDLRAWLKLDEVYGIAATEIVTFSEQSAFFVFSLPNHIPTTDSIAQLSLIIDGPLDGVFVRPVALSVKQSYIDSSAAVVAWSQAPLSDLHQRAGITFPFRNILSETIRNIYFHVSLWLAMMFIFIAAVVYAVKYLRAQNNSVQGRVVEIDQLGVSSLERADYWSQSLTAVGMLFGILGLVTGSLWARYTWGSWWNWDIKQFTSLIALLIYAGYFVLRSAFPDPDSRARISAVYNVFAFAALIPLIYVLPRMSGSSLHPGNGGNPALGGEDLDNTMRMVFYPAVIGWTLFGGWLASLLYRSRLVEHYYRLRL